MKKRNKKTRHNPKITDNEMITAIFIENLLLRLQHFTENTDKIGKILNKNGNLTPEDKKELQDNLMIVFENPLLVEDFVSFACQNRITQTQEQE